MEPRPYVRFTAQSANGSPVTLGRENPTRASSEAPGHSGRLANDGDSATFWQAAAGDTNAWLRVDLERIVTISKTKLVFLATGNWRYKIELSNDGENDWKLLADQTHTTGTDQERMDIVPGHSLRGRFLRVTVTGAPADQRPALAEVEVTGTLNMP